MFDELALTERAVIVEIGEVSDVGMVLHREDGEREMADGLLATLALVADAAEVLQRAYGGATGGRFSLH